MFRILDFVMIIESESYVKFYLTQNCLGCGDEHSVNTLLWLNACKPLSNKYVMNSPKRQIQVIKLVTFYFNVLHKPYRKKLLFSFSDGLVQSVPDVRREFPRRKLFGERRKMFTTWSASRALSVTGD